MTRRRRARRLRHREPDFTATVPWAALSAPPREGEVVRFVSLDDDDGFCVGLLRQAEPARLPDGRDGVTLVGVLLDEDTGHATWQVNFHAGDILQPSGGEAIRG